VGCIYWNSASQCFVNSDERRGGSRLAGCKAALRFEDRALRQSGDPVHSSVYAADSKPENPTEIFKNPVEEEGHRVAEISMQRDAPSNTEGLRPTVQ
jgi:hypothetical protein